MAQINKTNPSASSSSARSASNTVNPEHARVAPKPTFVRDMADGGQEQISEPTPSSSRPAEVPTHLNPGPIEQGNSRITLPPIPKYGPNPESESQKHIDMALIRDSYPRLVPSSLLRMFGRYNPDTIANTARIDSATMRSDLKQALIQVARETGKAVSVVADEVNTTRKRNGIPVLHFNMTAPGARGGNGGIGPQPGSNNRQGNPRHEHVVNPQPQPSSRMMTVQVPERHFVVMKCAVCNNWRPGAMRQGSTGVWDSVCFRCGGT